MKKAYFFAVKNDNVQSLKECMENGFRASYNMNWAMQYACCHNKLQIANFISSSYSINFENIHYVLNRVCMNGYLDILKLILSLQNVNAESNMLNECLCISSTYGQLPIVMYLNSLENVDVSFSDNTAIFNAYTNNRKNVVQYLLSFQKVKDTLSVSEYLKYSYL